MIKGGNVLYTIKFKYFPKIGIWGVTKKTEVPHFIDNDKRIIIAQIRGI